MKQLLSLLALMALLACKQNVKEPKTEQKEEVTQTKVIAKNYPEALQKVFETHGGLKNWKEKRTLSYTMPKPSGDEVQTIDLYSRKERIETPQIAMGFDGTNVWLLDEKATYKGDPLFYRNLMFYFYAMPFVLADDGINYGETEPLEYDGKSYPGIRIDYDSGVGTSPKDEYYLHYDPETYQMAWLGYTVTYRSGEKSDNVKWIRYNDWMNIDDLVLPKALIWHDYEGKKIKEAREPLPFENVILGSAPKPEGFYNMPKNAKVVTKQ
ncbi:DUF6503 family protein [Costertonia aggregata]|uniref:Threonine synthase n=1 Tax=Costertonia aggregata TaxID=343403 RepID=A0A7H9AL77_9FLAO|nr:DUF6503 family protein [Costertonia aggregata]QLG44113.1 hypothetical protein HYG79_01690 [Costertonia aggregata]